MIKEFEGRKFRTRDGKYDATIVHRKRAPTMYPFYVILSDRNSLNDIIAHYTETLRYYSGGGDNSRDLIETLCDL